MHGHSSSVANDERLPLSNTDSQNRPNPQQQNDDTNDADNNNRNSHLCRTGSPSCWSKLTPCVQCLLCGIPLAIFFTISVVLAVLLALGMNSDGSFLWGSSVCSTSGCVKAAGAILSAMNLSADPCDDFYQYACGGFELQQSIPAGQNKLTQFAKIDNIIQKELKAVLESPPPHDESSSRHKARLYYKSCMDAEMIKQRGIASMQEMVEKMGGLYLLPESKLPSDWNLNKMLRDRSPYTMSGFFHMSVGPDDMDVLVNSIQLDQGGLGLGSDTRDYYLNKSIESDSVLVAYTDMLEGFVEVFLGRGNVSRQMLVEVVMFEQEIAEIQQSKADQRDMSTVYHKVNVTWLQQNANFMDWTRYFDDLFSPIDIKVEETEPVILYAVPYFRNLTQLIGKYLRTEEGKRTLQNYAALQGVIEYAPKFGESFKKAFDTFMAVFVGKRGSQETWQICVSDTDSAVGYPLGVMYADKYFTPEDKERALFVMSEIVTAFRTRIERVPWMDKDTRKMALEKIDSLIYDVGYPKWLRNETYMEDRYAKLVITDDYTVNQFTSFNYSNQRLLGTLRQKPDKARWLMTPQTVNAYYEPTQNKFVVPAGILNIPFFFASSGVPAALNFGAIGSVTGHEITHGFDDQGCQYDKYGNLKNWWNKETHEKFQNQTLCLVDQYSKYAVNGLHLKGDQTLGENIADNGGVKTSYQAFKKASSEGKTGQSSRLVGVSLNADQLFFIGYAQVWCSVFTPEAMEFQIRQNEHSPGPFRVKGPLSNSPEFAAAFNCPKGSSMNPEDKCSVW